MYASIGVDFAGIHFINPFILSSAPPTATGEMIERAFEEGWGGAVIKTLAYNIKQTQNVNPRIHSVKQDGKIIGFSNFELGSHKEVDVWLEDIPRIKKRFPKNILFASLLHTEGLIKEQWVEVAGKCAEAGVDGFELNFSCSHGMAESGGGATIASNVELIKEVLGWVREAVDLPIMVKLPAVVENLPCKAKTAEENGADAISTINTINCLPGIDIYDFTPYPQVNGKSAFSGLSGSVIKPIGLRCVAGISREVNIPISGMGGISNWEDTVQYILAGASTVQVCSAVIQYGYRIINDLKQGLIDYMEEMNFKTIDDFTGLALKNIEKHKNLSRKYKLVSQVDPEKCVGCGLCSRVCEDGAYQAIRMSEKRVPIIDENKCDGCGLCTQICPIMGAMRLVRK
ncbi:MAG: NAD-dependent dihydropyrimidine dehydrogenase subunit PreA [Candidatus Neomarinimicrobiota bacterium]|nr:MAG: NAD-dependent dihydropyrimidine dehydrogenase subunit PreA [Candidatus Neomarinimicrobiota bacterium]